MVDVWLNCPPESSGLKICLMRKRKDAWTRLEISKDGGGQRRLGLWKERPDSGIISYNISKLRILQKKRNPRTLTTFECKLGKECVRSHQGEIRTPPAGRGSPLSRITCNSAKESPPPAESPETMICAGLTAT